MPAVTLIRLALPLLAGAACAWWIDRSTAARGLLPPGFADATWGDLRRLAAIVLLALVLWVGVFAAAGQIGLPSPEIDFENLSPVLLFQTHAILMATLASWLVLGYWNCGYRPSEVIQSQLGLRTPTGTSVPKETGLGILAGLILWVGVLAAVFIAALAVGLIGGFENLPTEAPEMVLWMGSLPLLLRLMVSLSAGVVEELFFRGFLMPRVGFWASNVLFVLAHASYQQSFQLFGVALLSVAFSMLVRWRGNIWPAIAAHFLFDAIQLLIIVPTAASAAGT